MECRESFERILDGPNPLDNIEHISHVLSIPMQADREQISFDQKKHPRTNIPKDSMNGITGCLVTFARISFSSQWIEQGIHWTFEIENMNETTIITKHQRRFMTVPLNISSHQDSLLRHCSYFSSWTII